MPLAVFPIECGVQMNAFARVRSIDFTASGALPVLRILLADADQRCPSEHSQLASKRVDVRWLTG